MNRWILGAVAVAALVGVRATLTAAEEDDQRSVPDTPGTGLRWPGSTLQTWTPEVRAEIYRGPDAPTGRWTHLARPERFQVAVYSTPEKPRTTVARVRRGDVMPAKKADTQRTCTDYGETGSWWEVPDGFICSASGFTIEAQLRPLEPPQRRPAVNHPLPFRYARIITKGAPRWNHKPSVQELGACDGLSKGDERPRGVIECMWDDFFVALDRREMVGDVEVFRTVYGEYVRVADTKILETSPLVGERLTDGKTLPVAFVYGEDDADIMCPSGDHLEVCGVAERYARFSPDGMLAKDGKKYIRGPDGGLVDADRVRIARKISRPGGVSASDKWVHIDLAQQLFVAYEGDVPVYTSLVTSGKPTHATPTGLYRVQRKYLSKIMRGVDPKEGIYHVEEVPWTTYYYGAYAVHGAYWHDTFGAVRSHGCTNVAPADARWLYYWADPKLEPQFHARVDLQATPLYFTNDG